MQAAAYQALEAAGRWSL